MSWFAAHMPGPPRLSVEARRAQRARAGLLSLAAASTLATERAAHDAERRKGRATRRRAASKLYAWGGRELTVTEWAQEPEVLVTADTLRRRIKRMEKPGSKLTLEECLTKPPQEHKRVALEGSKRRAAARAPQRAANPKDDPTYQGTRERATRGPLGRSTAKDGA